MFPPVRFLLAAACSILLPLGAAAQSDLGSFIRTPPAPAAPRINGARIYGERPGRPFFFHLPVTGRRPIAFSARDLPDGLTLDASTGDIRGSVEKAGTYNVTFTAVNSLGKDTAPLRIVIGKTICLTPQMGWNSWNFFGGHIDEAKIRGAADAMVSTGLIDHGWTYINMDDRWQARARDAAGNIELAPGFTDMKRLAGYIHGKGLKVGLYSSPGPFTCTGADGSYHHEDQDAAAYASWDIDYLKYDWCSYGNVAAILRQERIAALLPPREAKEYKSLATEAAVLVMLRFGQDPSILPKSPELDEILKKTDGYGPWEVNTYSQQIDSRIAQLRAEVQKRDSAKVAAIDLEIYKEPYRRMRAALDKVNRDIVFSFCQYGMGDSWKWAGQLGGNSWRTTGDINASWNRMTEIGFSQNGLERYAGPGHWNDPDMLEVGNGSLSPDENYTHMTLWCMLASPLLIGCEMPRMRPFIVSLFSNDEVLAVNQDALGKQGWRARQDGDKEVWMKPLAGGSLAVAFFNRGKSPAPVSIQWSDLKLSGPQFVRDLWRQKDEGVQPAGYTVTVAPHSAELFKAKPAS